MFRIKICGITNVPDAIAAVDAGADAIGLNFYEKSPRCVATKIAHDIADAALSQGALTVGVFVNHSVAEIRECAGHQAFFLAQLHGDESPAFLSELMWPFGVIRARRFTDGGVAELMTDYDACANCGVAPSAILVDAMSPGRYGGTGETVSWAGLADHKRWLKAPLILAGGLTPDNVAEAIRIVRPHGVDVASGVESAPGKKDPAKVRDFIAAARAAFEAL